MKQPSQISESGIRLMRGLILILALLTAVPSLASPPGDAQLFTDGFGAWQKKDYGATVDSISLLLKLYPETPLRDASLLLLARANLRAGNQQEAARAASLFLREYPNSPLKTTVEDELLHLVARYRKGGEVLASPSQHPSPGGNMPVSAERTAVEESVRGRVAAKIAEEKKTELEHQATLKAEQEHAAQEKAEQERLAKEKAELERLVELKAEQERITKEKAEQERLAKLTAEQERITKEKAEQERLAKLKAEQERLAKLKAEQGRKETEAAHARDESAMVALSVAPSAALEAAQIRKPIEAATGRVSGSVPFDFSMTIPSAPCEAGKQIAMPFEVVNSGSSADSFRLESALPAGYNARFRAVGGKSVTSQTPKLAPNGRFRGTLTLTIPPGSIDGEKIAYPVTVTSVATKEAAQSREVALTVTAPLVRVVARPLKREAAQGEQVSYRITVLNAGTFAASNIAVRLDLPPQYDGVESRDFRRDGSGLISNSLRIGSGEYKDISVTLRLKEDAETGDVALTGEVVNRLLNTRENFRSVAVTIVAK